MLWGAVLELIVAFAIVGTGVVLFPVLRRQNEAVALGFVTSRLFEAGVITVGILSLLSIVTLQQEAGVLLPGRMRARWSSSDSRLLRRTTGHSLSGRPSRRVSTRSWSARRPTSPPRAAPSRCWASSAAPVHLPAIGQVIGINEQYLAWSAIAVLPIFLWELLLGLWLVFKGFRAGPRHRSRYPGAGDRAGIRRRLRRKPGFDLLVF